MKTIHRFIRTITLVICCVFSFNIARAQVPCEVQEGHYTSNYACTNSSDGIFVCGSTDIASAYADNCPACSGANHCIYISLRNNISSNTCFSGAEIVEIKIHLSKDPNSAKFSACRPLTQWGQDNTSIGGSNWSTPWTMTHLGVPITDGQCVDWQASEYDVIDCTPPNAGYYIGQCYHWTVEVCGANTISLELIYRDGRVKVFEVPISANKCPDATGTYNH